MHIGGTQTRCSKADFETFIQGKRIASATLDNVGTFHFIFGHEAGDGYGKPFLVYYNEKEGVKHVSCPLAYKQRYISYPACVALDANTFLFRSDTTAQGFEQGYYYMVTLSSCWGSSTYHRFSVGSKDKMLRLLRVYEGHATTEVHRNGLARIRKASEGDLTLISNQNDRIKVHSSVLIGISAYFEALLKWNKNEEQPKELTIDIPTSTLEVVVRYFYGEKLDMEFVDACELIVYAQMSCLPELVHMACQWFKSRILGSMDEGVQLWKKSFEAQNSAMRAFSAGRLIEFLPPDTDGLEDDWDMTAEELYQLWKDVAVAMKKMYE
ncbi:hypothetical protein CJU90_2081 [Yarrowia sp. C11]|nr:hypothetical protein CKK34_6109 [Yarrowia sp. E02]KAG5372010.1 hypothetical protein CJU90_2081 [Yarrowia sp. C11]